MEHATSTTRRKTLVERAVPKPVRKAFRWMNFHFKEEGRTICSFAKTLPPEQRKAVIEHGKEFTTANSKENFPRGVRNVASSLVVGQCMWYFVCPALFRIDSVRESPFGWLAAGGLDKLFINADDPFFQTGGYSAQVATHVANGAKGSVLLGASALGLELATDFSRCYIEYWSQKKYGVMADGAARAYGQVRPFPLRYSSLEAYQKIFSYILRPWTIGTYNQIYSSVYGILGSIWRTGPQLAIVITAGRAIDKFFKKIAEWTRLSGIAKRIVQDAQERQKKAMESIREIVGDMKFTALRLQLAAESKTFWKWNPFRPALSGENAMKAAEAIDEFQRLRRGRAADCDEGITDDKAFIEGVAGIAGRLESVFGKKRLASFAPSILEYRSLAQGASDGEGFPVRLSDSLGDAISELQSVRKLS
ncbi:hypothetical protein L0Y65_00440 [Candidatus Micrarchaeota archaeon]|nr:hypothetical protein [Candidatus Micrarchaeota archaeon]